MDIKHSRRLISQRISAAIDVLQELKADVGGFEEGEMWLADGVETALEKLAPIIEFVDTNDIKCLAIDDGFLTRQDDDDEMLSDEEEPELDEDIDDDDSERELNFDDDESFVDDEDE